jgi:hypothetical protein
MNEDWGEAKIQGFRTAPVHIVADSIAEGFDAAKSNVEEELQKLSEAVKARTKRIEANNQ